MPLTDSEIKNAKPLKAKSYKLADGGGLFALVNPNGAKYWRLKYRVAGREKLLALGVYPAVSLKAARERRDDARASIREGKDPSAERKAGKRAERIAAANSFEAVAREYVAKQSPIWTAGHVKDILRPLEKDVFAEIGARPIAGIEPPDILDALRKIEARGAHDMAHRALQICGAVFRYGVASGRCKSDPSRDLKGALAPHVKRHMARLGKDGIPELLAKIDAYDRDHDGDALTRLALQLMALTFLRTNELIGARWTEFDFEAATWTVPAIRMKLKKAQKTGPDAKPHAVPLSRQVLGVLAEIKAISGENRFVFPGRDGAKPISNNTMLFALYRMGYKGRMTGHGFRGVASTILNEARGVDGKRLFHEDVIERQLAHCEKDKARGAYNGAEHIDERRAMMQWWGDHLDRLRGGDVVPIRAVG